MSTRPARKYGIVWHRPRNANDDNIGDDIQTLAAIELLRKNDITDYVLIERESIKSYDGEPINVVMNGWWAHGYEGVFPLPDAITPIFISFHGASRPHVFQDHFDYFKKYEPIGCRDHATVDFFKQNGVDAYFTGCLTLIFNTYDGPRVGEYTVDDDWCESHAREHYKKYTSDWTRVSHKGMMPIERCQDPYYRLSTANQLLQNYRLAANILTSRLHCALPAIAMGAQVIFNHCEFDKDSRFTGLYDILQNENNELRKTVVEDIKNFFCNYEL